MELRQLRYFITVVEAGSFTAAATALHISQPPLSVAIAKLESEVGVKLLVRTPRGAETTSAGRYLLDAASRVQGDIDEIISTLRRFGEGTAGTLTLAAVPVLMWHRVPQTLRAFASSNPQVEVRLVDPPPWQAIDMLESRTADLAAVMVADAEAFTDRHESSLEVVDWGDIPLVAALPPYAEPSAEPLPLKSLNGQVVMLPRRTAAVPSLPEAVDEAFALHSVTPAAIRHTETIQTGLPLIEAGLAVGVLPDPDSKSLKRFDITLRTLEPAPKPLRALLLLRRETHKNPMITRFLRTARDLRRA